MEGRPKRGALFDSREAGQTGALVIPLTRPELTIPFVDSRREGVISYGRSGSAIMPMAWARFHHKSFFFFHCRTQRRSGFELKKDVAT